MNEKNISILLTLLLIVSIVCGGYMWNQKVWYSERLCEAMDTIEMLEELLDDAKVANSDPKEDVVPEWFKKELDDTFTHGVIRIKFGLFDNEEDIIIMSVKAIYRLEGLADPDYLWRDCWDYGKHYDANRYTQKENDDDDNRL